MMDHKGNEAYSFFLESHFEGLLIRFAVDSGKINFLNSFAKKIDCLYSDSFYDVFRVRKEDILLYVQKSEKSVMLNVKNKDQSPLSFYFHFKIIDGEVFAFGQQSYEEFLHLKEQIVSSNSSLNNLNRDLQKQKIDLRKLNELKNQFLGIAAHDLRNPIGVIRGYSGFLLDSPGIQDNEDKMRMIGRIKDSADFMLGLLDELLDISVIEAGKLTFDKKAHDLFKLVKKVAEMNQMMAGLKGINISIASFDGPSIVDMDSGRIEQVLNNLISNAIKFSEKNTRIELSVFQSGDSITVLVKDNGKGIPKDEIDSLFEAYSVTSVKSTAGEKSTGLGLSIVQKIIIGHGGRIWVDSTVGIGSSFYFSVPMSKNKITGALVELKHVPVVERKPLSILLIDDSEDIHILWDVFTKDFPFTTQHCNSALEAIDLLRADTKFDVIFVDFDMPEMSGKEFLKFYLTEAQGTVTVCALMAHKDRNMLGNLQELGFSGHLDKPMTASKVKSFFDSFKESEKVFMVC